MPSNIWLFDINRLSPTTSSADLSSHDGLYFGSTATTNSTSTTVSTNDSDGNIEQWPICPASMKSQRTRNPIREIVDPIVANSRNSQRDDDKEQISLALGDPTAHGNFPPCPAIIEAIKSSLDSPSIAAGYVNACGTTEAREAVASYHSCPELQLNVSPDDVILANGCSGALELAITSLLDEGSVLLVPRPGFPLYEVIANSHGARVEFYDLDPNTWECNLEHMEQLIIDQERSNMLSSSSPIKNIMSNRIVRGIVINNPGNPTGSVYSENHLRAILRLADRYRLPIIADEVYGDLTYGETVFHPLAQVAFSMGNKVPIITASGLGKQYLVPGWRVGWIIFHDNTSHSLREVKNGAKRLAQVILGASHLVQCAVPAVLTPSEPSDAAAVLEWREEIKATFDEQASLTFQKLRTCPGLTVTAPQGAMYMMIRIDCSLYDDTIENDVEFTKLLLEEENVFVLPGGAFGSAMDLFRVCFGAPTDILERAFDRIGSFCRRHYIVCE